jgi:hypothetical protein
VARAGSARAAAIAALELGCPRCGARRAAAQRYCLECGLPLPRSRGPLARLRRLWLARLGWYPGDFIWATLLAALLAAAGGAGAIAFERSHGGAPATLVAPAPTTARAHSGAPGASPGPWTIVLASLPLDAGARAAKTLATRAKADGLPGVAVLRSARYASLLPGYEVVVSGLYATATDAQTGLRSVQARGYAGAYVREIVAGSP